MASGYDEETPGLWDTSRGILLSIDPCEAIDDDTERTAREMINRMADKWSLWVLHALVSSGRLRFSRLLEQVEGISQKMLTKTLRQLEADGLVTRTMYMEVPPRVEYELTALGRELLTQVSPFWAWIVEHVPDFEAARERYHGLAKNDGPSSD